ncbi:hypothetical protein SCHPADRAFT_943357 [Schizopora paradoxa]|uniref:Uncharacterized protein n=1 Tax=Schizopora paradoxa TaxID=27342 RepID=A0A0H2RYA0_9AGAM|nr:hypothetical protein SCHPADRAFT_943357 [Schizopora paradoxa]
MSNTFQSFVGVWRIGDCEAINKFYFSGPIIDGVVDDGTKEVRIALTVATTEPYIQILTLEMNNKGPNLRTVQRLEGARHVFLLKDSIIGYGSLYGDDTFPLISDWRTLATKRLLPALYLNNMNSLLGDVHSTCRAMSIWRDHIFVVLNYSVEVFRIPSFESLTNKYHQRGSQSLYFPMARDDDERGWVAEAFINEIQESPSDITPDEKECFLRIALRDRTEGVFILTLIQSLNDLEFHWKEVPSRDDALYQGALKTCMGSSGEYLLDLSTTDRAMYPVTLEIIRANHTMSKEEGVDRRFAVRSTTPILSSPEQLPLDSTTALDFDDAAGVILVGNCRGEINIVQLIDTEANLRSCYLDDLPPACNDTNGLIQNPIPMRLPHCYYLSNKILDAIVPPIVREEAIESWCNSLGFADINPPRGWSTDWRRNTSLHHWVLPFPRWCTLSVDKRLEQVDMMNCYIRGRLGSLGDIIPLMYYERKHDFVIFKISQRIYYPG